MEESVKERLIRFIKYENLTKKKFEEECGLSNGYIGSIRKSIGKESLNKILLRYTNLNRDWLLYGEGAMLRNELDSKNESSGQNLDPLVATIKAQAEEIGKLKEKISQLISENERLKKSSQTPYQMELEQSLQ